MTPPQSAYFFCSFLLCHNWPIFLRCSPSPVFTASGRLKNWLRGKREKLRWGQRPNYAKLYETMLLLPWKTGLEEGTEKASVWLSPYLVVNALCSYNWDLTIITYFMCRNGNYEKVPRVICFLSWNLFILLSCLSQQSHAVLDFWEFLQHLAHLGLIKLQTEKLRFLQNKIARTIVEKDWLFR